MGQTLHHDLFGKILFHESLCVFFITYTTLGPQHFFNLEYEVQPMFSSTPIVLLSWLVNVHKFQTFS
jgi:hypothetical protein